jgi:hypothetical protein
MRTRPATLTPTRLTARRYLAEVKLRVAESELSWIGKSLNAACLRLRDGNLPPEILSAAYISHDDRLVCIVEAGCVEDVHRLFGVAMLPSARVVGATLVALQGHKERVASSGSTPAQPSRQPPPSS